MQQTELTFVSAQMPEPLAIRARIAAAQMNVSRSEFLRRALVEYLEKQPKTVGVKRERQPT